MLNLGGKKYPLTVDLTRSSTSKTELLSLSADKANVVRGQLGIDLLWVCVGSHKIGPGLLTRGKSTSLTELLVVPRYGCPTEERPWHL